MDAPCWFYSSSSDLPLSLAHLEPFISSDFKKKTVNLDKFLWQLVPKQRLLDYVANGVVIDSVHHPLH